jgi:DNA-binding SARP family transcriptional activator/tetratricopeptide (TPR) repeat protein
VASQVLPMAADLEFCLLGPVEVRRSGAPVPIAAGRQRALLAALLLNAGTVVLADDLIDVLWAGEPPASARASLHNYVRRLRIALGEGARNRIVTRPQGYLIRVDRGELDVIRFVELLADARAAARDSSWRDATRRARAALALWRGEPLADTGSDALTLREAPRLAEMRLQCHELAIDAGLRLGPSAEEIGELQRLAAEHPLRERLHALLMLALFQDGRQGEALAAYQRARQVLLDELGAEPGAELRELHQRILAADPSLTNAPPGPATGGPAASRTLPRDVVSFTGRQAELARVTVAAAAAGGMLGVLAISGMAGVGKTAFAVHAAHRLTLEFPDGQLFVPLHGHTPGRSPIAPAHALASLLVTAGFAAAQIPPGLADRTALWRDYLAGQRVLLVLDDAVSSDQVDPLLPGTPGSLVLVTSRRHLTALADAQVIGLDVMPPLEAEALLVRLAGRPGLMPGDPAVTGICALSGYLPLAIAILAGQLRHHPAWTTAGLAHELAAARDRLETMSAENISVVAAFGLSCADLNVGQRRLFRRLGLHLGSDIDGFAASALDGCSLAEAQRGLRDLYDHCLLAEPVAGRYRLHDLLREYARTLAQEEPARDRSQATGRLLDYYTYTATLAEARLAPQTRSGAAPAVKTPPPAVPALPDSARALAWARAERSNLLACLDYVTDTGQHAKVVALTDALCGLLRQDGPWADAIERHAVAVQAARLCSDRSGEAQALNNLAVVRYLTADFGAAERDLTAALSIYQDLGDRLGRANTLANLGFVCYVASEYPAAAQALESALAIYRDLGDQLGRATTLKSLGAVRQLTGEYPAAAQALESALRVFRDLRDQLGQANTQLYLGAVYRLTGNYEAATRSLESALGSYRDLGHRLGQANALTDLGVVCRVTGDCRSAARFLESALVLYRDLGQRQGQANALSNIGALRRVTREFPAAYQALCEALRICRDLRERGGEAEVLNEIGALHLERSELGQAETCHRQALNAAREICSAPDEARALAGLGRCAHAAGRAAEAQASLRQAHQILLRTGAAETADLAAELAALGKPVMATRPPNR